MQDDLEARARRLLAENQALKAQLPQWSAAIAERDQYIGQLHAERDGACAARDRYQANGKRLLEQYRELESIFGFPGALTALRFALHPDTGKGGDIRSRTAITQTLNGVVQRLGIPKGNRKDKK
jgi:hypothetical protein